MSPPFLYLIFGSSEPQNLPNVRQVHLQRSLEIGRIKEFGIGLSSSEELETSAVIMSSQHH